MNLDMMRQDAFRITSENARLRKALQIAFLYEVPEEGWGCRGCVAAPQGLEQYVSTPEQVSHVPNCPLSESSDDTQTEETT